MWFHSLKQSSITCELLGYYVNYVLVLFVHSKNKIKSRYILLFGNTKGFWRCLELALGNHLQIYCNVENLKCLTLSLPRRFLLFVHFSCTVLVIQDFCPIYRQSLAISPSTFMPQIQFWIFKCDLRSIWNLKIALNAL